ncbi:MAG: NUDIX domain-containing protein [Patescibacteria group bacterium]
MELQVGVKAIAHNKEGKYLLLHRSTKKYKNITGLWDIVGGRINSGVGLRENLAREIREEIGLELTGEPRLIGAQDIFPRGGGRHVVRLTYIVELDGDPKLDKEENDDYRWVTAEELKSWPDLDMYLKEILGKYILR